jgi:signal transduction histidine kinase
MNARDPGRLDRLLACLQAALGHELPNRLVALQGLLRAVEADAGDRLDSEQREFLGRAAGVARRTHLLVEELARLVRDARETPAPAECDLDDVVRETAAEVNQLDPAAVIEYHVADPVRVKLSPLFLRPILVRLVRALARAAGSGGPLRVEVGVDGRAGGLRLWLRDDGPGWPADRLARAFEPFAGGAREDDTGLGLYPVRHLVEGRGGRVAVAAQPGRGTTFTIAWDHSE